MDIKKEVRETKVIKPKSTRFNFVGYRLDVKMGSAYFDYRIEFSNREPLDFTETIVLPEPTDELGSNLLMPVLQSLHLILGVSYYKLYLSPKISIPYKLSREQADFWNTVYRRGLGEMMFSNNLDPKKIATFPFSKTSAEPVRIDVKNRILLGIGGGKDSIVAAELLRDFDTTSLLLETQRPDIITEKVIDMIGNPSLKIKRILDAKIFEKHEGSYNGHVPFSAILAWLGILFAAVYKYKYVAVGVEHSSDFGQIKYKGEEINHQWSKSSEFESMLQSYMRKYVSPDIIYFSPLRQYFEIKIVQLFAEHKKYFPLFTSCNRSFKVHKERPDTLWCGECAKCAFVFALLAAFLPKSDVLNIFKKNLFADEKLIPMFRDLLGFGTMKPFDCVGTFDETKAAFYLASSKFSDDIAIKTFISKIKNPQKIVDSVLRNVPSKTLPTQFRFLGAKKVCILGYGQEGKVTEQFLKKFYPHLSVTILDQALDKNYLKKQSDFDLAIKTPGIHKDKVTISYVTATNIFFSHINNFTVGITGSKGKSTTTTLIYDMVRASGKKARLIGNIGKPMLEVLLIEIDPEEIFVIELSSYMLDDIEYSPNIALLINLFPEHMDFHGGVENYYAAKEKIFAFQKPGDIAIRFPFKKVVSLDKKDVPLLGAHNMKNIQAAATVARAMKISDADIARAVKNFKPLPHRLQHVGTFSGISFYDDAISTTPESTIEAIKTLKKVETIFLGGEDRGYDFRELETILRRYKIKNIVLFPKSGERILKSRRGFNILETSDMKKAVEFAFENTSAGSVCLLSTASPSYSIWKNFEEKGDLFKKHIREIAEKK